MERRIIHLDMDAFYASVEQRDRPELRGLPVVVGGSSRRAVVAAASYEARKFGIRSAMPMFRARRLCPDLVIVDLRMEHYRSVSQQIRAILARHTELIEPLALDECFLDVSEVTTSISDAAALARRMKEEIRAEIGLTASAGVGPNKFVAKIASDLRKPDGLVVVEPAAVPGFLAPLPVSQMWGVGKVTERRLKEVGIHTLADLAEADPARLQALQGKHGPRMVEFARGEDHRPVQTSREPKSVSNETTFDEDTTDLAVLTQHIERLAQRVSERLARRGLEGRTVVLKLTYRNFQHASRRTTLPRPTGDAGVIASEATLLLGRSEAAQRPIRLVGVGVAGLSGRRQASQLTLETPGSMEGEPPSHRTGGPPVIKSISMLTRKDGLTHEQFVKHWLEIHGPLAHRVPGLRRYVQSHIVEERRRPDIPALDVEVDGIAELWYDDRESMARALASPEAKALHADGALFIGRIKTFTVEERLIV